MIISTLHNPKIWFIWQNLKDSQICMSSCLEAQMLMEFKINFPNYSSNTTIQL